MDYIYSNKLSYKEKTQLLLHGVSFSTIGKFIQFKPSTKDSFDVKVPDFVDVATKSKFWIQPNYLIRQSNSWGTYYGREFIVKFDQAQVKSKDLRCNRIFLKHDTFAKITWDRLNFKTKFSNRNLDQIADHVNVLFSEYHKSPCVESVSELPRYRIEQVVSCIDEFLVTCTLSPKSKLMSTEQIEYTKRLFLEIKDVGIYTLEVLKFFDGFSQWDTEFLITPLKKILNYKSHTISNRSTSLYVKLKNDLIVRISDHVPKNPRAIKDNDIFILLDRTTNTITNGNVYVYYSTKWSAEQFATCIKGLIDLALKDYNSQK